MGAKTDRLREELARRGHVYTCGLVMGDHRVNVDNVTTIWPVADDASRTLCIEEDEDGALWVADDVTVEQAIAAAMCDRDQSRADGMLSLLRDIWNFSKLIRPTFRARYRELGVLG